MTITYALGVILVVAFGTLGTAKLAGHPAMRARAAHVGLSTATYRRIGALEILAVVGLLAGTRYEPLAIASAAGLGLLLAGAVLVHIRNGDGPRELSPALVLGGVCVGFVALALAGQS